MALTEQQMVVNHFCMAHNVKLDSKQYGQQLAMAKRLIEKYNRQSVELIIDYTSVFVKQRIYSIKYFEYIFERLELLPQKLLKLVFHLLLHQKHQILLEHHILNLGSLVEYKMA